MTKIVSLEEMAEEVPGGIRLGIGGAHFMRLPITLIESVLALGRRDFTFISWGGGLSLELFLEAQAVKKLVFCFSSLDVFGLAPRFREALEKHAIEVEEWSALAMIQGLKAAFFNLPEMPFQLPLGSDLMRQGDFWRETVSSFTGQPVGQVRRLDLDLFLLHAQRADRKGNIEIQGARAQDLSMLGATKKTFVTVEEIVPVGELGKAPKSFVLPHDFVSSVASVPLGAYPTSCLPYYAADYQRLLTYVQEEQAKRKGLPLKDQAEPEPQGRVGGSRRFQCSRPRLEFLDRAARIEVSELTPQRLSRYAEGRADDAPYTEDELLVACLAREYDNSSVCSVGSVSPLAMVSYLLAKWTHAPEMVIIALNGGYVDIDPHPMSLTLAEPLQFQTAKVFWGGDETYHWYYQTGRVTHEVITVAQLDLQGRTNNAWIEGKGKRLRLPGQGGMADVANLHQNFLLYLTRHSPERFVEKVSFCTAARGLLTAEERLKAGLKPGKVRLISNLASFELNEAERRFQLISLHPGVTLEEVRRQTGGRFLEPNPVPVTQPPSKEELRLLRRVIDPFGIRRLEFVPSKERLGFIGKILEAEEKLVNEAFERSAKV